MRDLTSEEEALAAQLFASSADDYYPPHKDEGDSRLTVRFDSTRPGVIFYGPHARKRRIRIPGAVVLSYKIDTSAKTPTGGRYIKQSLRVRTEDGRKWAGQVKSGTDVVILRKI